jgi:hypothetical protein
MKYLILAVVLCGLSLGCGDSAPTKSGSADSAKEAEMKAKEAAQKEAMMRGKMGGGSTPAPESPKK